MNLASIVLIISYLEAKVISAMLPLIFST